MNNVVTFPLRSLKLTLDISDPEVLHELERQDDGGPRDAFAAGALRIGVLALRQASGSLDADVIRRQGEHLLSEVDAALKARTADMSRALGTTMQQYLDPASGALPRRIDQLTRPNGDLEAMLAKHVGGDQSVVAQTLAKHIGEQSPLLKMLSPTQSDGLLATLSDTIKRSLDGQRDEVLKQFSLDRKDSALSRLLAEVTSANGKLGGDIAEDVAKVVSEFSLDNEAGALSRLKREVLDLLVQQAAASTAFQSEVRATLETFKARREEAARTTLHGNTFEVMVGEFLEREARRVGDVCEQVGATPGRLQRKFGDCVVELGPESGAPGARVVVEAKARKRYTMKAALAELADARRNRDAKIGVFVFDRESAPEKMEPLHRVGVDVFVVWDAEDVTTDTYLKAAVGVARTLAVREGAADAAVEADFRALDKLMDEIAAHVASLEAIEKAARGVKKHGETILNTGEVMRSALERQVAALRMHVRAVRGEEEAKP